MKKSADNREYYEVFDFSPEKEKLRNRYEILYAIIVLLFMALLMVIPGVVGLLFRSFLISCGVARNVVKVVSPIVLIVLYAGAIAFIFAIADQKIKIPDKLRLPPRIYMKRYYLNVPQAYTKVHYEVVKDGDVMDGFYLNGAICSDGDIKRDHLSYIYNVLNDEYNLQGKDITMYKIPAPDFFAHYTFFEASYRVRHAFIYLLPLSELGIDREKYLSLKEEKESAGHDLRFVGLPVFADLVEARSDYRRTTYLYRDAAKEFFKDKQ